MQRSLRWLVTGRYGKRVGGYCAIVDGMPPIQSGFCDKRCFCLFSGDVLGTGPTDHGIYQRLPSGELN